MTHIVPAFDVERCAQFLAGTEGAPPRAQLMQAIAMWRGEAAAKGGRALDLGCGPGREVIELLRAGFEVVAIDPYPEMLKRTRELVANDATLAAAPKLNLIEATLEQFAPSITPSSFDLIHAGFILPFVQREHFASAWSHLSAGLKPQRLFVGQFFGADDEFIHQAAEGTMTSHTATEVRALLQDFDILTHDEVNRAGHIGRGQPKWWHVHHVIATKC